MRCRTTISVHFSGKLLLHRASYPYQTVDPAQLTNQEKPLYTHWTERAYTVETLVRKYQKQVKPLQGVDIVISHGGRMRPTEVATIILKENDRPNAKVLKTIQLEAKMIEPPVALSKLVWSIVCTRLGLQSDEVTYPQHFLRRVIRTAKQTCVSYNPLKACK